MIRPAEEKDIAAVHRIETLSFSDPWPESELGYYVGREHEKFYVSDNGGVDGFVIFSMVMDEAEIYDIAVAPECRGQGIGRRLVSFVQENASAAFLEVRAGNLAAIALYKSRGFETAGIRKKYYGDGEDALIMIWKR